MRRAALDETLRRAIALHMMRRRGHYGAVLIEHANVAMRAKAVVDMAAEIRDVIEAEHPGTIEP